jgi:hypothetical protein
VSVQGCILPLPYSDKIKDTGGEITVNIMLVGKYESKLLERIVGPWDNISVGSERLWSVE